MISSTLSMFITFASLAYAVPTSPLLTEREANGASSYKYLFTFGDSYSQTGFDIKGTKPSASNPIGNPAFPGYTTSGGNNWLTYLSKTPSPSLLTYNFASGGATTSASLVKPYASTVLSLIDQVTLFTSNLATSPHPTYAPWTSADTLFGIWIGVNDVGNVWSSSNWTALSENIIDVYLQQVEKLYVGGARNLVMLTVPPIELTPLVAKQGNATQVAEGKAVVRYNELLKGAVEKWKAAKTDQVKTWVVDTAPAFNAAVRDPKTYGAKDASCYNADGVSCLWFNDYHPGQAIQKLVGAAVQVAVGL
ncbi:carbohydrate esterase family 16 protein [Cadophora sp. DSE1049]|nr:carbohydrate esterase family 16 protein [Cadophora sp. DSE1049]